VTGVMKMVLALQHQELPRTLHADEPSPHVDWSAGDVRLLTEAAPWPVADGRTRRAGISGFGISGTNAHIILEEPPAPAGPGDNPGDDAPDATATGVVPGGGAAVVPLLSSGPAAWLVSGHSAAALAAQASRLGEFVAGRPDLDPADVAWSLAATRSAFEHRAVVTGSGREELATGLAALAEGEPGVVLGSVPAGGAGRVGLVFSGQGSQRAGMAAGLHAASAVFAAAFDAAAALLEAELGVPVAEVALGTGPDGDADPRADQTLFAQPALFALQTGLVAVLAEAGITADAVAGHSVGEVAAAHAAGVLSLADACRLVAARARLMQELPPGGAMCAVAASEAEVSAALEDTGAAGVSIAAVNGPAAVVVSGDEEAVAAVAAAFAGRGTRTRMLRVSHAFHSARMDPVLGALDEAARALAHNAPRIPWAGALDGDMVTVPSPDYWAAAARLPVRFADAVAALTARGVRVFIEIGPDGTLSALGPAAAEAAANTTPAGTPPPDSRPALFIPVQRPGTPAPEALLGALARAHVAGTAVDWARVLPAGQVVDLPTYAFQHQRYWAKAPRLGGTAGRDGAETAAESRFWAAVEGGDLAELAGTLAVDGQRTFSEVLPALASWRRRENEASAVANWRYQVTWVPVADQDAARLSGTWLVITGPDGHPGEDLAGQCLRALADRGAQPVIVRVPAGQDAVADALADQILAALAEWRPSAASSALPVVGVLSLLALDEAPLPGFPAVPAGLAATLSLVQALGAGRVEAPLWMVTCGAVATAPHEAPESPLQAQTWGLGRVAALEHPDFGGGLIDLPLAFDERAAGRLCAVVAGAGEDQVAIRGSGIYGRRLTRASRPPAAAPWKPAGSALITGGTGAIGGHVARWLAARSAPRLILASRSGPGAPHAAALAAELAGSGTAAAIIACDTASRPELVGLLARGATDGPPLTAVFHAAGVAQTTAVYDNSLTELSVMTGAKAAGASHLDELTADLDLEAFVLFSSIAAIWGSGLQCGYAAANSYLDALAASRRARGLAATSVSWGPWGGGGMTDEESVAQLERRGLRPMTPELAIGALAQALDGGTGLVTVADVDWARFAPPFTLRRSSPLIGDLPEVRQVLEAVSNGDAANGQSGSALADRLAELPRAEQDRMLIGLVQTEASVVLGHASGAAVGADRAFTDLGADSLTAVELRDRLGVVTGIRLPATLLFDYPTPVALADYLRSAMTSDGAAAPRPLLAELDRLESMLSAAAGTGFEGETITARLEAIAAKWKGIREAAVPAVDVTEQLESSTDDEVFDFIVNELGIN
jgi:acyl transferase domain-containing protein